MSDQSHVYVGVAGYFGKPDHPGKVGVFRRPAQGGDWQHVLGAVEAYTVVVHPQDPEIVFAGTNDGVWRSTDRGATFRRTGFPDTGKQVWCFMVDSRDPQRIFAGGSPIDVYRSDDGGAHWRKLPTPKVGEHCKGPFASRVMRLAQNPKKPDEIYAALEINGVMRSADGGQSWQRFDKVQVHGTIMSIGLHPRDPNQVYIGARYDGEVFGTRDAGKTWQAMPLPGEVQHIYSVACG